MDHVQQRRYSYSYPRYVFANKSLDIHEILRRRLGQHHIEWSASR